MYNGTIITSNSTAPYMVDLSTGAATCGNVSDFNPDEFNKLIEKLKKNLEVEIDLPFPKKLAPIDPKAVKPSRITVSGPATRVLWEDGEQTVVKLCEDDCYHDSVYVAFCIALAKRIYGTNSALHRAVREHTDTYLQEKARKEKEEARAKQKAEEELRHNRKVRKLAKRMKLETEARNYLTDAYIKNWTEGESS